MNIDKRREAALLKNEYAREIDFTADVERLESRLAYLKEKIHMAREHLVLARTALKIGESASLVESYLLEALEDLS